MKKRCDAEYCKRLVGQYTKYCSTHRTRIKKGHPLNGHRDTYQDPNVLYLGEDLDDYTFKLVTYVKDAKECWNVNSHVLDKDGYGLFRRVVNGVQYLRIHRASYAYYIGELEDDEVVRHTCDNPSCINPSHLIKGSHQENMNDRRKAGNYLAENMGTSKLTKEQVLSINSLIEEGIPLTKISEITGVNRNTIYDIQRGQTWSYVTGREKYKPKSRRSKKGLA